MKETLIEEFDKYKPQLKSFLLRMTANVEDTEDLLQETYIKAFEKLSTFKGNSSLKTWIFSIAHNHTLNFLRSKKRWAKNVNDIGKHAALTTPGFMQEMMSVHQNSAFIVREHINFCFTCIGKTLPLKHQIVLLLKEIYAFKIKEIGEIINESEGVVKHSLLDARNKMKEIFDHRCSLINKNGICHQCSELDGIFNPKHETQKELLKIKMVECAKTADKEELLDLRIKIVQAIDPFQSEGADLQLFHLKHTKDAMEEDQSD